MMKSSEFEAFQTNGEKASNQFAFWNGFIKRIYPVLRDLTRSHREGNWPLHLSAVQRALPLSFAFDRTNYKRWLPLYFEDCLSLPERYPSIHENFLQGEFVVKLTKRKGSCCSCWSSTGIKVQQAGKEFIWDYWNNQKEGGSLQMGFDQTRESQLLQFSSRNCRCWPRRWIFTASWVFWRAEWNWPDVHPAASGLHLP